MFRIIAVQQQLHHDITESKNNLAALLSKGYEIRFPKIGVDAIKIQLIGKTLVFRLTGESNRRLEIKRTKVS